MGFEPDFILLLYSFTLSSFIVFWIVISAYNERLRQKNQPRAPRPARVPTRGVAKT